MPQSRNPAANARRVMLLLAAAAAAAALVFFLAPFAAPYGTYWGLDGSPGMMDRSWEPAEFPYIIGDILCHQESARCFVFNGSQMPICIRDTGLLIGFVLGCLAYIPMDGKFGKRQIALSLAMVCFTAVEWAAEPYSGDFPRTRFLTGIVSGAGAGMLLGWLVRRGTSGE